MSHQSLPRISDWAGVKDAHQVPTEVPVATEEEAGRWSVDLTVPMSGTWEFTFALDGPEGEDAVVWTLEVS